MADVIYDIQLNSGSYYVTIAVTVEEEIYAKELSVLSFPTQPQNYAVGPEDSKMIDFLKVQSRYNIDGYIANGHSETGVSGQSDSSNDAKSKKSDLINILKSGGVFNLYYTDGTTKFVNCEKLAIKNVSGIGISAASTDYADFSGEAEYSVKMTLVEGEDLI